MKNQPILNYDLNFKQAACMSVKIMAKSWDGKIRLEIPKPHWQLRNEESQQLMITILIH